MDTDKLIKLIKLANHNPNDHEANSAARRVCKMIEEAEFRCLNGAITEQSRANYKTPDDIFRDIWVGFDRAYKDPGNSRSYHYGTDYGPHHWTDPFNEPRERKQQVDQYVCVKCANIYKVPAYARVPDDSTCPKCMDELKYSKAYKSQERSIKCKECGVVVVTKFDRPDDQFICYVCRIKK